MASKRSKMNTGITDYKYSDLIPLLLNAHIINESNVSDCYHRTISFLTNLLVAIRLAKHHELMTWRCNAHTVLPFSLLFSMSDGSPTCKWSPSNDLLVLIFLLIHRRIPIHNYSLLAYALPECSIHSSSHQLSIHEKWRRSLDTCPSSPIRVQTNECSLQYLFRIVISKHSSSFKHISSSIFGRI